MKQGALLLLALGAFAGAVRAADDTPAWLKDAAAAPPGTYSRKVPAVILLKDEQVAVEPGGQIVTRTHVAVRVLNRDGRDYARGILEYDTSGTKIREFRGWLLPPKGAATRYGKERVIDVADDDTDVYGEARKRVIVAGDDAQDGAVFGYEIVTEEKSVFTQLSWGFQSSLPTAVSRYSLTLPAGWTAKSITYNHAPVEPVVSGSSYTWELRDLPYIEPEEYSPKWHAVVPRLAISYFPGAGAAPGLRGMTDWTAVSRFLSEIADPLVQVDAAITERAQALTSGAATELDKIRAIGAFVQKINYIAIQTNVLRGGGYKPHAPRQVLDKRYGDCKDKANLMRTMLKAAGITAYMTSIYSGDPTHVRDDWASPHQFNHVIVAVKIGEGTQGNTVVTHPQLGRLLIFDPTDDDTPVGDLPRHEQGSLALVAAGEQGALLKMPLLPAEANRVETVVSAKVSGTGAVEGISDTGYFGQTAVYVRRVVSARDNAQQRKVFEHWLSSAVSGAQLTSFSHKDSRDEGRLDLHMVFAASAFGKSMQGRLLMVSPGALPSRGGYSLPAMERKLPLVLHAELQRDTVTLDLPDGFVIDELPDPVKLESPFGKYQAVWKADGKQVVFRQSLEVPTITAPASEYKAAKTFFEKVNGAAQSPVVLLRKS